MYSHFYKPQTKLLPFIEEITHEEDVLARLQLIYIHPFNQQLFSGTLAKETFSVYLQDDFLYLHHYALALQHLAMRLHSYGLNSLSNQLNLLGTGIIQEEQAMHQQYIQYRIERKPGKTITQYVEFLQIQVSEKPLQVALCSIFPCFWVYYQLGKQALSVPQNNNHYKPWIDTYTGDSFVKATLDLMHAINQLAATASADLRKKMRRAFVSAVQYELEFFDTVIETNLDTGPENKLSEAISASPLV